MRLTTLAVAVAPLAATDRLIPSQNPDRTVSIRRSLPSEVEYRSYRIVYRLVGQDEVHVLTVHDSSRRFPRWSDLKPNVQMEPTRLGVCAIMRPSAPGSFGA